MNILESVVEHWREIFEIVGLVLGLLGAKKLLALWRALKLTMTQAEGQEGTTVRAKVERAMLALGRPSITTEIVNMAARVEPGNRKKPSLKESMKSLAPDLLRIGLGRLFGR